MKTFLISLERAKERRQKMTQTLDAFSMDYEIFDAVDGMAMSDSEIANYCDLEFLQENEYWFPRGMIGCCLSHYSVYVEIVKRNLDYAFIIEDDAKINHEIPALIEKCKNEIRSNEIILLYYQTSAKTLRISNNDKIALTNSHFLQYPFDPKPLTSTGAYIITQDACKNLIDYILPVSQPPDAWGEFYENCLDSIRIVYPRPMVTYDYRSTITNLSDMNAGSFTRVIDLIDKYNLPILSQALALRRRFNKCQRDSRFELTDESSLITRN
ncbi:MAG: glycosyltransferase family 25 protein [Pyrinomonadaceae bacterium]|nr:glycosyltransferase family 25 protein [Pyrinomonadaceae bacterium]